MQLGDKKLIVQRASVGKTDDQPAVAANAPVTLQVRFYPVKKTQYTYWFKYCYKIVCYVLPVSTGTSYELLV